MKSMNAFDCGSTGALEISWFHQLSDGKSARPARLSLSWTSVDVGAVGAGAGAATCGGADVVGVVGVSGVALDPPHAVLSAIAAIVKRRMNRRPQCTGSTLGT